MTIEAFYLQAATGDPAIEYTAQDFRFLVDALADEGVLDVDGGHLAASQRAAGADLSVDVAAGNAIIDGDDEANQGAYLVRSTAVENVGPFSAAPGTGARIDLVVLEVRDEQAGGPLFSDARLAIVEGTAAAAPVAPAVPDTAIPIAEVRLNAGNLSVQTANITDRREQATNALERPPGGQVAGSTTTASITNTTTESSIITVPIPAGLIEVGDVLRFSVVGDFLNNSGAQTGILIGLKLGGTVVFGIVGSAFVDASASRRPWRLHGEIFIDSLTAQRVWARLYAGAAVGAFTASLFTYEGTNTAAENFASAVDFIVRGKMNNAATTIDIRVLAYTIEHVKAAA